MLPAAQRMVIWITALAVVAFASFTLGYLGMPLPLRTIASLGLALLGTGSVMALEWALRQPRPPSGPRRAANAIH